MQVSNIDAIIDNLPQLTPEQQQQLCIKLLTDFKGMKTNVYAFLSVLGLAENEQMPADLDFGDIAAAVFKVGKEAVTIQSPFTSTAKKEAFIKKFDCMVNIKNILEEYKEL